MALLNGSVVHTRPVPHEEGCWFEFRQLSWAALRDARHVKAVRGYRESRQEAEAMGPDMLRMLRDAAEAQVKAAAKPADGPPQPVAPPDPAAQYDPLDLLCRAVVGWGGPHYDGQPITPAVMAALDEQTVRWAVAEVVAIHHPPTEAAPTSPSTSP